MTIIRGDWYNEDFLEVVKTKCFKEFAAYASCSDEKSTRITEIHLQ